MDVPSDCVGELNRGIGSVHCVEFSENGAYCMSGGQDRTIRLWNTHKLQLVHEFSGVHGYDIYDLQM
jgi:mitogen-activated protein kinase organizer 1